MSSNTQNTSKIHKNLYILGISVLVLYLFGFTIYSGYTADHNKPDKDSGGLYIASYVICIIQCIIYLGACFYGIIFGLTYNFSNSNNSNESNNSNSCGIIPLGLNIYWLVVYFNYNISEKYDEYALVKTIEFFSILGVVVLSLCFVCIVGFTETSKEKNKFVPVSEV